MPPAVAGALAGADEGTPQPAQDLDRRRIARWSVVKQVESLRTAFISLRGQPSIGLSRVRGRELAVVKELMPDWAPTQRRHRAVAQLGCASHETEEQADAFRMLGDVADGIRSLSAELALAERE